MALMAQLFSACYILAFYGVLIFSTILWIWMMVDCATKEPEGLDKIVWAIIIVPTHFIGALIYFFARRKEQIRIVGR